MSTATDKIFDPADIFNELQINLDPSIFEAIDERHIDKAPNILEWSVSSQYLNTSILPRQLEVLAKLLADWCPRCSKPGYIETLFDQSIGNIRDNMTFLEHGKCPTCKVTRFELVTSGELIDYNELVGCIGQRSGKSKMVALLATYVLHRFLKIPNPLRHFNQPSGELLMGTFSALVADQARDNLWEPFKGFIDASPWFQNYHKFLKAEGKKIGTELFIDRRSFIGYSHKHMMWHYTGSEDKKMRGKTRIFASPDEIGWMISDDSKKDLTIMNADAVYTALNNSLSTMRIKYKQIWGPDSYDTPSIIMASISSPSAAKDKIMRLLKDASINPKILGVHDATWKFNPDYSYDSLREEKAHMPESEFMRDFGAEPPLAADPYLSDPRYIDRIATGTAVTQVGVEYVRNTDSFGDTYRSLKAILNGQDKNIPRMLTFDLGYTKNGLAICMFSLAPDAKIRLDFAVNLMPEKKANINVVHVFENLTVPLVQNFNIQHAFFDRWNSLDQVQRLRDMGVEAAIYSMTYKDMSAVKGVITSQGVTVPQMARPMAESASMVLENDEALSREPVATLGMQLLTVRDLGNRVTKPIQGDDDLFRAFALGVNRMSDNTIQKEYAAGPHKLRNGHTVRALGTVRRRSEGGGGVGFIGGSGSAPGVVKSRTSTKR